MWGVIKIIRIKIMIKIIKTFLLIGHNEQTKNQKNLYRQDVSKCGILAEVCVDPVGECKLLLHPHLSTTTTGLFSWITNSTELCAWKKFYFYKKKRSCMIYSCMQ